MRKTTKAVVASLLAIAVCVSLVSGATFALFTSQSETNITVTSGKVSLDVSAELIGAYSAQWTEPEGGGAASYISKELEITDGVSAVFTNGGSVNYDKASNALTLVNVTPGDGAKIRLTLVNHSTVATKYRIEIKADDAELMQALAVKYTQESGEELSLLGSKIRYTDWSNLDASASAEAGTEAGSVVVDISLPVTADDVSQDKSAVLNVSVFAVQQNGEIGTPVDHSIAADPSGGKTAADALKELAGGLVVGDDGIFQHFETSLQDGDALRFEDDIYLQESTYILADDITIDLNDNELVRDNNDGSLVVGYTQSGWRDPEDAPASAVIENGTIVSDGTTSAPVRLEGSPTVTFRNVDFVARNTTSAASAVDCFLGTGDAKVTIVFEECTFTDMILPLKGRSGESTTADIRLSGCTFKHTKSMGNGAAILPLYMFQSGSLTIENCQFEYTEFSGNSSCFVALNSSVRSMDVTVTGTTFTYTVADLGNSMCMFSFSSSTSNKYTFTYSDVTVIGTSDKGTSGLNFYSGSSSLEVTASGNNTYTLNGKDVTATKMK